MTTRGGGGTNDNREVRWRRTGNPKQGDKDIEENNHNYDYDVKVI